MICPDETLDAQREARLALALARVPRTLSDDELRLVRRRVERSLQLRGALRTVRLENDDGPAFGCDPSPGDRQAAEDGGR